MIGKAFSKLSPPLIASSVAAARLAGHVMLGDRDEQLTELRILLRREAITFHSRRDHRVELLLGDGELFVKLEVDRLAARSAGRLVIGPQLFDLAERIAVLGESLVELGLGLGPRSGGPALRLACRALLCPALRGHICRRDRQHQHRPTRHARIRYNDSSETPSAL